MTVGHHSAVLDVNVRPALQALDTYRGAFNNLPKHLQRAARQLADAVQGVDPFKGLKPDERQLVRDVDRLRTAYVGVLKDLKREASDARQVIQRALAADPGNAGLQALDKQLRAVSLLSTKYDQLANSQKRLQTLTAGIQQPAEHAVLQSHLDRIAGQARTSGGKLQADARTRLAVEKQRLEGVDVTEAARDKAERELLRRLERNARQAKGDYLQRITRQAVKEEADEVAASAAAGGQPPPRKPPRRRTGGGGGPLDPDAIPRGPHPGAGGGDDEDGGRKRQPASTTDFLHSIQQLRALTALETAQGAGGGRIASDELKRIVRELRSAKIEVDDFGDEFDEALGDATRDARGLLDLLEKLKAELAFHEKLSPAQLRQLGGLPLRTTGTREFGGQVRSIQALTALRTQAEGAGGTLDFPGVKQVISDLRAAGIRVRDLPPEVRQAFRQINSSILPTTDLLKRLQAQLGVTTGTFKALGQLRLPGGDQQQPALQGRAAERAAAGQLSAAEVQKNLRYFQALEAFRPVAAANNLRVPAAEFARINAELAKIGINLKDFGSDGDRVFNSLTSDARELFRELARVRRIVENLGQGMLRDSDIAQLANAPGFPGTALSARDSELLRRENLRQQSPVRQFVGGVVGADRSESALPVFSELGRIARISALYSAMFQLQDIVIQGAEEFIRYREALTDFDTALEFTGADVDSLAQKVANLATASGVAPAAGLEAGARGVRVFNEEITSGQATAEQVAQLSAQAAAMAHVLSNGEDTAKMQTDLIAIAKDYNLAASDQVKILNAAQVAFDTFGTSVHYTLDGLAEVAPEAAHAGISLEKAAAQIAAIAARTGKSGDVVANDYKRILAAMSSPNVRAVLRQSGIDITQSVDDQFRQIQDRLRSGELDPKGPQFDLLRSTLGERRSGAILDALFATFDQVDKAIADYTSKPNRAEEVYGKKINDLGTTLARVGATLLQITVDLANSGVLDPFIALLHAVDPLLRTLDRAIQLFNELPRPIRSTAFAVGELYLAVKLLSHFRGGAFLADLGAGAVGDFLPALRRRSGRLAAAQATTAAAAGAGAGQLVGGWLPVPAPSGRGAVRAGSPAAAQLAGGRLQLPAAQTSALRTILRNTFTLLVTEGILTGTQAAIGRAGGLRAISSAAGGRLGGLATSGLGQVAGLAGRGLTAGRGLLASGALAGAPQTLGLSLAAAAAVWEITELTKAIDDNRSAERKLADLRRRVATDQTAEQLAATRQELHLLAGELENAQRNPFRLMAAGLAEAMDLIQGSMVAAQTIFSAFGSAVEDYLLGPLIVAQNLLGRFGDQLGVVGDIIGTQLAAIGRYVDRLIPEEAVGRVAGGLAQTLPPVAAVGGLAKAFSTPGGRSRIIGAAGGFATFGLLGAAAGYLGAKELEDQEKERRRLDAEAKRKQEAALANALAGRKYLGEGGVFKDLSFAAIDTGLKTLEEGGATQTDTLNALLQAALEGQRTGATTNLDPRKLVTEAIKRASGVEQEALISSGGNKLESLGAGLDALVLARELSGLNPDELKAINLAIDSYYQQIHDEQQAIADAEHARDLATLAPTARVDRATAQLSWLQEQIDKEKAKGADTDPKKLAKLEEQFYGLQFERRQAQVDAVNAEDAAGVDPRNRRAQAASALRTASRNLHAIVASGDTSSDAYWNAKKAYRDAVIADADAAREDAQAVALAGVDPRDSQGAAVAAMNAARDNLNSLPASAGPGTIAAAQRDYAEKREAVIQGQIQYANTRQAARVYPGDRVGAAKAQMDGAKRELDRAIPDTIEWWQAYGQYRQSQEEYAQAVEDGRAAARRNDIDISDPVASARAELASARDRQRRHREGNAPWWVREQDDEAVRRGVLGARDAAFQQRLQDTQHAHNMGRISDSAYLQFLNSQAGSLRSQMRAMGKNALGYRDAKNRLQQIEAEIKGFEESVEGQYNIGNIKLPTIYEVRRAVQSQQAGLAYAPQRTNYVTVNINGDSIANIQSAVLSAVESDLTAGLGASGGYRRKVGG